MHFVDEIDRGGIAAQIDTATEVLILENSSIGYRPSESAAVDRLRVQVPLGDPNRMTHAVVCQTLAPVPRAASARRLRGRRWRTTFEIGDARTLEIRDQPACFALTGYGKGQTERRTLASCPATPEPIPFADCAIDLAVTGAIRLAIDAVDARETFFEARYRAGSRDEPCINACWRRKRYLMSHPRDQRDGYRE